MLVYMSTFILTEATLAVIKVAVIRVAYFVITNFKLRNAKNPSVQGNMQPEPTTELDLGAAFLEPVIYFCNYLVLYS